VASRDLTIADTARWFGGRVCRPDSRCILFCLPYSGGGASVFHSWRSAVPAWLDIAAIHLPGREDRINEPLGLSPDAIAAAIATRADRPYALYGHSFGARLGFEVVRAMRRHGGPLPVALYAAAARPPHVADPLARSAELPDEGLLSALIARIDAPAEIRDIPELRELLLPVLRADLEWINLYQYRHEPALPVPIVCFAGMADTEAGPQEMLGWSAHTSATYRLHTLPGGHFFLRSAAEELIGLVSADLRSAAGARGRDDRRAAAADPAARRGPGPAALRDRDRGAAGSEAAHLVPLPGSDWMVWRAAVLRTTGFPADGLARLSTPVLAAAADELLDERAGEGEFGKAWQEAVTHCAREVYLIATDPLFREAVTWQSRSVLSALDGIGKAGPAPLRNRKQRERERIVARYWQRYCAKAETIGFFGPVCWVTVDGAAAAAVTARPGSGLVSDRKVFLDHWALSAYAQRATASPQARDWLRPALQPQLALHQDQLLEPNRPPVPLSRTEAAILARCDGRTTAIDITRAIAADPESGLRSEADAGVLLDQLVRRGLLRWDLDLPVGLECEDVLRARLAAIGDEGIRSRALGGLDRLGRARDEVAAAAGDPDALATALARLDAEFTAVTGSAASRNPGEMYVSRGICWEETTRDLDVTIGKPVLEAITPPLSVLLRAARWLSAAMAEAYLGSLRNLYEDLAADLDTRDVPLGQLWFLAQGLFYGTSGRPADAVAADLTRRLAALFGLDSADREAPGLTFRSAELIPALAELFPGDRPGWSAARLHSPDLQLCAESTEAINRGDFSVVLGELHAAWATNTCGVFVYGHPDVRALRAALVADVGPGRVHPLLPTQWPRHTSRLAIAIDDPSDALLAFMPAPGADPDRVLPVSAVSVTDIGGELTARALDGRCWPLVEIFARPLSEVAVEGFKLAGAGPHTPRVTIDRLVAARETWRTTVGECGLAPVTDERERFLAARRWRRELRLPESVFVKIGTETKPVFVDFTSPLYVASFATMLRAAQAASGSATTLTVTEALPAPGQAWVPDHQGRRYLSELRLQIRDRLPCRSRPGTP
jgi:surfactin synthase thioesterase subunit